jgi:hypothetical protein
VQLDMPFYIFCSICVIDVFAACISYSILHVFEKKFILICSMLNKLSNGEKITKNGALQREIWRSKIGPAARVFQKNPSKG